MCKVFPSRLTLPLLVFWIIGLAACAAPSVPPVPPVPADQLVILHNGAVVTLDAAHPEAQAMALLGNKILAVGSDDEILALRTPGATVIDLHGRAVLPGFVDAHTHILNDAASQGMSLDEAQALMLSNGITTVGDLYIDRNFLNEIRAFEQAGQLRLRTNLYLVYNDPCGQRIGDWYTEFPATRVAGEMLRIGGVKIFTDGGSCGKPALSFELDRGQGLGDLWLTQDELNTAVAQAQAAGYQVAIHAIGDRAVQQAQDAIAFALDGQPNTYRHRMEHVSVIRPEQLARFGELGIIPIVNGQYNSCQPFGSDLPEPYQTWEWPWRALRDQNPGLPIAWHADYPFLSVSPIVHLYGFVTRRDPSMGRYDCQPRFWLRDDLLTTEEALRAMTLDAAYALFREDEVGSLEPGKFADMVVLSDNPLALTPDELKFLRVELTIAGGRMEYCAPDAQAELCPGFENRLAAALPDVSLAPPVRLGLLVPLLLAALLYVPLARTNRITKSKLILWGGLAGMLGGILWAGLWLWEMARNASSDPGADLEWALVYALALLLVGLFTLQLAQKKRAGVLGWLVVALTALGMMTWMVILLLALWLVPAGVLISDVGDSLWLAYLVTAAVTVVGSCLTAWVAWRASLLPLWTALFMVLPLLVGFGLAFAGQYDLALSGMVLFGIGWAAIGGILFALPAGSDSK